MRLSTSYLQRVSGAQCELNTHMETLNEFLCANLSEIQNVCMYIILFARHILCVFEHEHAREMQGMSERRDSERATEIEKANESLRVSKL